jgi:sugar diacid utilization regulator
LTISLNIILDTLKSYKLESYLEPGSNVGFSTCLPLPDNLSHVSPACLYIGRLSKALAHRDKEPNFYCLCLRDRVTDAVETADRLRNFIIVNENISLTTLLSQVQSRFFEIIEWQHQMNSTLVHGGSLQEIVDIGADFMDNYIAISDASLMLMAYSKNIPCDCPICEALVQYGYHPEESIQKFRKNDLLSKWQHEDAIYIDDTKATAKYEALNKIFKFRDTYFAHVVMTCNRHAPTPGMVDLFQLFLDVLGIYIENAWEAKSSSNHVYDSLLTDLLEGNITSQSVVEERAQYVDIPATGQFYLFQIVSNDPANMSIGKAVMEFSELFPRMKLIRYQQRIIALNPFSSRGDVDEQLRMLCLSLENILLKYDAVCGVSLMFSTLHEMKYAYQQSTIALEYYFRLQGSELSSKLKLNDSGNSRIHFFKHYYLFCLLGESKDNPELWYHSEFHHMLNKLHHYDLRHKSNTIQLLNIYLNNERSATKTGSVLNMHRNNVLYHVNRIEELLNIDFDDPTTRFMMLLSFSLLQLFGFREDK